MLTCFDCQHKVKIDRVTWCPLQNRIISNEQGYDNDGSCDKYDSKLDKSMNGGASNDNS